jgi:ArsR family transcriptional regulator, arsenate/arsenite/antimonite-responsive transcriptional repressor
VEKIIPVFKAMADETRLRILKLLACGDEVCVCELTDALEMTQPNVSFHLGILREAGLIKDRREGRWSFYQLDMGDMLNRVLVPTSLERVTGKKLDGDKKRLDTVRKSKEAAKTIKIKIEKPKAKRGRKAKAAQTKSSKAARLGSR